MEALLSAKQKWNCCYFWCTILTLIELKPHTKFSRTLNPSFNVERDLKWCACSSTTNRWFSFVWKLFLQIATKLPLSLHSGLCSKGPLMRGFPSTLHLEQHPFHIAASQHCAVKLSVIVKVFCTCPVSEPPAIRGYWALEMQLVKLSNWIFSFI